MRISKESFLGFWVLTMFVVLGCSGLGRRALAGDAGLIGPSGEVALFFKEGNRIVVKQCGDYTVLKSRNDCVMKPGTRVRRVPTPEFKNALRMALAIPGNYDAATKRELEVYNQRGKDGTRKLQETQEELKAQIAKIEAFVSEYGVGNDGNLSQLRQELASVEAQLGDAARLSQVVAKINREVDQLVDEVIADSAKTPEKSRYVFSTDGTSFVFNLLKAYVQTSTFAESFQRIGGKDVKFTMGSPETEKDRNNDEKQAEVTLSKAFEMMTTEVTQQMWFYVMGNNPSRFKTANHCSNHFKINGEDLCPDRPVEKVSWNDVREYIKRRNEAKGLTGCQGTPQDPKGCYRLPTEAEWEYAARGGTTTSYSFGNDRSRLKDYAWYTANSNRQTHPVETRMANPYGLRNMHGNVWEWVQDYWTRELPGGRDPLVVSGSSRVIRGGSWGSGVWYLRSANRSAGYPDGRSDNLGFRLVRNL